MGSAGSPNGGSPDGGSPDGELPRATDRRLPEPTAATHRGLVLIAIRQPEVQALAATILEAAGYRIRAESRGEDILAQMETWQPDLILVEPVLDDMPSFRLCARIRALAVGRTVPILVISDAMDSAGVREVLAEELTDFVSSPVSWKVLTFRIHRWISIARKLRTLSDQDLDLEQVRDSALRANTELLQLRNYDSVTDLPNREMFLSTVGLALSQSQRSSDCRPTVLYLDIDDFNAVNDLVGRTLGDELLRIVARRIRGCLREGDFLSRTGDHGSLSSCARLHGDHFAILLSRVAGREGATAVARRLLESLSRPVKIRDRQLRLSARIGIAEGSSLDGEEEEILVQRAEIAMRYCKQHKGKAFAFFDGFMNDLVVKKLELQADLRQALEEDQLSLSYQLLVDGRTSAPRGVEGLARWHHPSRGPVPPGEFTAVAEESDLILELDRWVLREGCRQGKRWLDAGFPPFLMSLNVSMRFLEQDDFADQVLAIVEETGLPPSSLQLELSERGTLPDADRVLAQFESLVSLGVRLALDDFGTGQTSLSYLRTLPIRCVKVDRSFVRRLPEDSASVAIVSAIAAMSHHLGLKVVAEGVENEAQWRFLAEQGYDQLQGFLFGRPEPAADLGKAVRSLRRRAAAAALAAGHSWSPERPAAAPGPEGTPGRRAGEPEPAAAAASIAGGSDRSRRRDDPDRWSESEGHLLQLARRDFLTRVNNRFSFDERLEHAVAHADRFGHQVALLLIDLDDFKWVNDTHGHAVGDELLVALAGRLDRLVRKVDTLARIGGDEFAVLLSEFREVENVAELASRLLAVLARPVEVDGRELRVTGSVGVALYPSGGTQAKHLLQQADLALYEAKNQGGNRVRFFAWEMGLEAQRNLALARDLRGAVDRGELYLEYQLQVALASGSIVGVEALLRWNHPTKGLVEPECFLPVAESTGEIWPIGCWVIRSACAQAQRWRSSAGRDIRVSVNLSPVQCRDRRFVETILQILDEFDLPPELLDLELSERVLNHLPRDLEASLRRLGDRGVGLTLDNFGSGASALEHFHRFRFDRLKIHQSVARTIGRCSVSASVVSGLVALARKLDVQIVAEGIETPEELRVLVAEGCEVGQGFLFSRPLSADSVSELMSLSGAFLRFSPQDGRLSFGSLAVALASASDGGRPLRWAGAGPQGPGGAAAEPGADRPPAGVLGAAERTAPAAPSGLAAEPATAVPRRLHPTPAAASSWRRRIRSLFSLAAPQPTGLKPRANEGEAP